MIDSVDTAPMNEKEHLSIKPVTFEFGGGTSLELHAQINDATGKLLAFTESDGTEMSGTCTIYETYFDESALGKIQTLFDSWGVSFEGTPWETEGQEDLPGDIQFSWDSLNEAIKNETVVFEKDTATGVWFVDELFNML